MSTKPDTITIETSGEAELTADFAAAVIVLEGSTAFTGSAAFKKAKEVTALVDALASDGLEKDSVTIRDVRLEANTIVGIKSSSCQYTLRVNDIPTDLLPKVLGTIASSKQADLRSLQWIFSKIDPETETLRQTVIQRSLEKANATAAALGVSILGVFDFTETVQSPGKIPQNFGDSQTLRMRKAKGPAPEIGFSLIHTGKLKIETTTEFRVSMIA